MRTLVFGSSGQLGRECVTLFGGHAETRGADLPEMDVTDAAAVTALTRAFRPGLVINAAAYTNVDAAEDDAAAAFAANEHGARNVAEAAAVVNAKVIYYSTDYVFGGTSKTPYAPGDPLAPVGVYARSKAAGEEATRLAAPAHFIIRTAWLYGPGGDNFVEKILRAAAARPELKVVDDEVGSPTYTRDLAEATFALCQTEGYGTYHVVNAGQCSRCEFAKAILRLAGFDTRVVPCGGAEFPTKAERPPYSVLSSAAYEECTGRNMRPWEEALAGYMQRRQDPR